MVLYFMHAAFKNLDKAFFYVIRLQLYDGVKEAPYIIYNAICRNWRNKFIRQIDRELLLKTCNILVNVLRANCNFQNVPTNRCQGNIDVSRWLPKRNLFPLSRKRVRLPPHFLFFECFRSERAINERSLKKFSTDYSLICKKCTCYLLNIEKNCQNRFF